MNSNLVLVPLLLIPMCYQLWLLWDEFLNGFTPQIFHRLEPFTDLPGITVCIPLKYSVPEAFIRQRINQSDSTDLKNACTRYKAYLQNPPENVHGDLTEYNRMTAAREKCYEGHFLWSDPSEPLYLTNFTSAESHFMVGLQKSKFIRTAIYGHLPGPKPHSFTIQKIAHPNMISFHHRKGLCWTYFSRATRDWVETLQYVLEHRSTNISQNIQRSVIATQWTLTRDGDLQAGNMVSRHQPEVWPYRLAGLRWIGLTIDFLRLLQYWHGTQHGNLTALQNDFTKHYNAEADLPLEVMAHSPYETIIDRSDLRRGNGGTSYWAKSVSQYYEDANSVLLSHNLSILSSCQVAYSKTTLQHVTVPGRYSMYCQPVRSQSGYSDDDCHHLKTVVKDIELLAREQSNEPLCIPLETVALSNSLQDQLDPLDLPFCRAVISESSPVVENNTNMTAQLLEILKSKKPTHCPGDETRIVFKFRTKIDGQKIQRRDSDGPNSRRLRYSFQFEHDKIPELTIRFVAKMSAIELLANGCGLCGIWIGFSFLGLITSALQLIHSLKFCTRPLQLKQINKVTVNQFSSSPSVSQEKYLFKKTINWIKLKNCQRAVMSHNTYPGDRSLPASKTGSCDKQSGRQKLLIDYRI